MHARWLSSRSVLLHLVIAVWVPGCAVAAWWQVTIALAGDRLGWLYSVEWPCFAVFGVVVWWNLIHDDPETVGARGLRRAGRGAATDVPAPLAEPDRTRAIESDDPELAAYNEYLERLAAREPTSGWKRS